MKKIVYATQMFALMAMFPVVVILDLNRVTPASPQNDSPSNLIEKTMLKTRLLRTAEEKIAIGGFSIRLGNIVLKNTF